MEGVADVDKIINIIGLITMKESDAYSTQGSYYRWAKGERSLPVHMLVDCFIEQICMAMEHLPREAELPSVLKYVSRAVMTWEDIKEFAQTQSKVKLPSPFPHPWWGRMKKYLELRRRCKLPLAQLHLAKRLAAPRLGSVPKDCRTILSNLRKMKGLRALDYDV